MSFVKVYYFTYIIPVGVQLGPERLSVSLQTTEKYKKPLISYEISG